MDVNNKLHKWYTSYPLSEMKKKILQMGNSLLHFEIIESPALRI